MTPDLELALVGNCSFSALIDSRTNLAWSCLPRYDSNPIFHALLSKNVETQKAGIYAIELLDFERSEQTYLKNTAVVRTHLFDAHGGGVEVTDFAPRFKQFGRMFRPLTLVRLVRPLSGSPRIRIKLRPRLVGDGAGPAVTHGSNHVRFVMPELTLRVTTDASITALLEETAFLLEHPLTMILGPDETLQGGVSETGRRFYEQTMTYWHEWVRTLGIPYEWQDAVIRAAITLKLNAFDDTGAVVAAMTTSIPEAADSGRNWDYRHCWLRDAQFVVSALNRLGTTPTMERYLAFIVNVAAGSQDGELQPVYGINGRSRLEEKVIDELPGYRGMGPVRFGNQAHEQTQNDVYGASVLAATHMFFDERLEYPGDESLFQRLEHLGHLASRVFDQPDAGPWEFRSLHRVHTHSAVMCWAAADRLEKIARRLGLGERASSWNQKARDMHATICKHAWNEELQSFTSSFDGDDFDATLLLLAELGFIDPSDPRFATTVAAVAKHLLKDGFLFRYVTPDDFGLPKTAFIVCSFWYVDALHALGREQEARALFERLLSCRNRHGLLSEDIDPRSGELWGNFPQTYSMVGLINSARKLSQSWEQAF